MRFLILADIQVPNLASKILVKGTRRLRDDWQVAYSYVRCSSRLVALLAPATE
ncbi:MAG: hypothetical protein ACYCU8_13515 [Ferrimicrobium acidiphilum]